MRIDFRRKRFIVSLSQRDVLRLLYSSGLTSTDAYIDGLPADDHALVLRLEPDDVHYETPPEPLPPAEEAIKTWMFQVIRQEIENPELWLDSPKLVFREDGQLVELTDHRSVYLSLERFDPDRAVFDVDGAQVHVVAACEDGNARIFCWLGDESGSWSHLRDLALSGDEARRLIRFRR